MGRLAQRKYLVLLVVIVAYVIWSSFTHHLMANPIIPEALVAAIVLAVLFTVFTTRFERAVAFTVAVVALAIKWSRYVFPPPEGSILQSVAFHAVLAAFLAYAVFVILQKIFAEKAISADEVLGTVCGYILAAACWAHIYAIVEIVAPGSFAFTSELDKLAMSWDGRLAIFNYFSLVTITTVGYGDVTPVHPPATALATLEVVFGQFYIAIVVAQLVGLQLAQAMAPKDPR